MEKRFKRDKYYTVQFSLSVVSESLRPQALQHTRPPCPSPTPGIYSNSCLLSQWCQPTISSSEWLMNGCQCSQSLFDLNLLRWHAHIDRASKRFWKLLSVSKDLATPTGSLLNWFPRMLSTTDISFPTVPEAGSPRSKCQQGGSF